MTLAGDVNNLTPAYDKQHDVYRNCLALLDNANTLISSLSAGAIVAGVIFGLTNLQWRKADRSKREIIIHGVVNFRALFLFTAISMLWVNVTNLCLNM